MLATAVSAICFLAATAVFLAADADSLLRLRAPAFWLLVALVLAGSVAGSMRNIVMSTCVTLLVPEERRDRANGLVGSIGGVSFAITSVFSGLVIGKLGMGWALYGGVAPVGAAFVHLRTIHIDEPEPVPSDDGASRVDIRGALEAINAVSRPGASSSASSAWRSSPAA